MTDRRTPTPSTGQASERGQSLVEAALVLPVLLLLVIGILAIHRVALGQLGVSGVAREAAAVGALSDSPAAIAMVAQTRGLQVAQGYGLTNGSLRLQIVPRLSGRSGDVAATARYDLDFSDLPLLGGWSRVTVSSTHVAAIDPYRSRWGGLP